MRRSSTSSLMALAQGRACSKVVSAKDEPPSRWQDPQRLSTMCKISPAQVILVEKTSWALSEMPTPTINTNKTNFIFVGQVGNLPPIEDRPFQNRRNEPQADLTIGGRLPTCPTKGLLSVGC